MTEPTSPDHDGYDGPAGLVPASGATVDVVVTLRGGFQPADGRYHWYGRVQPGAAVDRLARAGSRVLLRTPHGEAPTLLSDRDPWGRYRVAGVGRPPFQVGSPDRPG